MISKEMTATDTTQKRFWGISPEIWLVLGLAVVSLTLNFWFIDVQTYHPDEYKKVLTVTIGKQSFQHPQLMRRLLALWAWNIQTKGFYQVLLLGHWMTAVTGMLVVIATYAISRRGLGIFYGFLCALAVAVSPIIVIHSHYLKEDILLTLGILLSLGIFSQFLEKRNAASVVALGIFTGLTISTHYKGVLLPLIYIISPLLIPVDNKKDYYLKLLYSLLLAFATFFTVNNLFVHYKHFVQGATYEFKHSVKGHKIVVDAWSQGFLFHLKNSLIPGTSWVMTVLGLGGLGYCLFHWKNLKPLEQLMILTGMIFYGIHEISPNKPFPDYMRYVIPVVPFLFYTACKGVQALAARYEAARGLIHVLFTGLILMMLTSTLPLLQNLPEDTRVRGKAWCKQAVGKNWQCRELNTKKPEEIDFDVLRKEGVTHVLINSDMYERYFFVRGLKNQSDAVYQMIEKMDALFAYSYIEIKPAYKNFAFSNPTVRIVDIRAKS